jgi:4-amino-4-deoxy-L-arabinose transferase-like glycosyltransferase
VSPLLRRLVLLALVLLTVVLRLWNISKNSITQDESTMILFAQGVLERGYPFLRQANSEFIISTYELVPYPIAASMAVFGFNEFAVRLPAVFFAAGTCVLLFQFGRRLFDVWVGFLAALLFAVLPWAIYWGSNCFYPSQVAFFSLCTTMVVHRLIEEERPRTWVYYALAATFTGAYLSWEGTGFLLPCFFVMILVFRWGRFQWMKDVHGWIAASAMIFMIVAQLTYRTVLREPYLGIQTGRSEISFATLAFKGVAFDPYFYITGLFSEAHITIACMLVLGVLLLKESRSLRFLYLFFSVVVLMLTAFLGYYALRYVYLTLPSFLLSAAAVSVALVNKLTGPRSKTAQALALAGVITLHLTVATPWGFKPIESAELLGEVRPYEMRQDLAGFPFRGTAQALKDRMQQGDILIVQAPFPFQVYTGIRGDYFLQSVLATSVFYDPKSSPYYTDKWVANPVLRSKEELDDVMSRHSRIWLVSSPDGASRLSIGDELYRYFEERSKLVEETADGKLFLYERPGLVAGDTVSQ